MKIIIILFCMICMTGCQQNKVKPSSEIDDHSNEKVAESTIDSSQNINQPEETMIEENITSNTSNATISEETPNRSVETKEEIAVQQIEMLDQEVHTMLQSESSTTLKEKVIDKFIILVDFIYYDVPINDVYFKDLTASLQNKVRSILERMDTAIENKIPNYKDTLKAKYQTVLSYLKEKTNVAKEKIESAMGSENYDNFKQSADDMKESFQNVGSAIAEGASSLYEKGKEKVSNWYQELKENHEKES